MRGLASAGDGLDRAAGRHFSDPIARRRNVKIVLRVHDDTVDGAELSRTRGTSVSAESGLARTGESSDDTVRHYAYRGVGITEVKVALRIQGKAGDVRADFGGQCRAAVAVVS